MLRNTGSSNSGQQWPTYSVTIPSGYGPGSRFQADLSGQIVTVIVPPGYTAGSDLLVRAPPRPESGSSSSSQKYQVEIPPGIEPGGHFQASLSGRVVWLQCPQGMRPGDKLTVDGPSTSGAPASSKSWPPPLACPEEIEDNAPEYFICPISGGVMAQPAITPTGTTYDRKHIENWLASKNTDPTTNTPLTVEQLYPNRTVRSMIEDWIATGGSDRFLTLKREQRDDD